MKRNSQDKNTRRNKEQRGDVKQINPKFKREREQNTQPLKPWNEKQKEYIYSINCNPLTIATGFAGSSKTYIPTVIACDMLKDGLIDQIVLTRPNVSSSKSLGYFGGSLEEKMSNWLGPVLNTLYERLGRGDVAYLIEKGDIQFVPLEVIKGYSFNRCFILCDEAEDLTREEFKKVITRLGKESKMVLAGDITQSDLKQDSGLKLGLDMAKKYPDLNCGYVDFNHPDDIVRSDTVRKWILKFNKEEV